MFSNVVKLPASALSPGLHIAVLSDLVFYRAKIVRIQQFPFLVTVQQLDTGLEQDLGLDMIHMLPGHLDTSVFPAGACLAHVVGVSPSHHDPDWSNFCTKVVEAYLKPEEKLK